jgi:hypothetical protein
MAPQRPNAPFTPNVARKSGSIAYSQLQSFDSLKARILSKLEDRFDLSASKRMPASLLRQSIRTHAEQLTDQELRGAARPDRERLIDEVLAELLGYGPLDSLFKDPTVREIMVTGPHSVIVRREQSQWLPTSIKYRDEEHVRWTLDKLATHADAVGGTLTSVNMYDLQLPNGFRGMAIIPPPALGQPATVAFIRVDSAPAQAATTAFTPEIQYTAPVKNLAPASISSSKATARPAPGSVSSSPRPGSNSVDVPAPRSGVTDSNVPSAQDPLARHRNRIIERLIAKLANLGVYDLQRVEITELRRVVTAYVREYVEIEKVYLSETDQCRLMLEILSAMQR